MTDKRMTEDEVVAELRSGMTIGIGGWGSRRKPMSLIRAILRSDLDDLTIVAYGGPDLGLLCAAGKVRKAVYAFVSLDTIPLEPHFRAARQSGAIEDEPWDEGLLLLGLQAANWRVPFLPTRVGLGSDLFRDNPRLRTVTSPYDDGETLVAAPALRLDAALVHLNRADPRGNAGYLGPDPYFDDLFVGAADKAYVSAEYVVPTDDLEPTVGLTRLLISRLQVDGVVEATGGAHFTSCVPDYDRDETFQKSYAASAKSAEAWAEFKSAWLDLSESDYQEKRAAEAAA
ncbi:MAG: acyl CoA--acetate/3-ketoacid CoA transferase subunit alpha [Actinomycetota bacterium]|nr:CoA transferase subunit A [Acidimicrobiia bacterium]MDQ3293641.1 acyl CoA--acetate/3-ketoacid CoA transferase subunit alpha [Actinomycetota bacterium]